MKVVCIDQNFDGMEHGEEGPKKYQTYHVIDSEKYSGLIYYYLSEFPPKIGLGTRVWNSTKFVDLEIFLESVEIEKLVNFNELIEK